MKVAKSISALCALFIAAVFVTGCTTTVDLNKFHDANLKEADVMPSKEQLKQGRIKVVVFEAEGGRATNTQLGEAFAKAVENELEEAGAEIVDRNLATKLKDELKLTESSGAESYKGPQVAQYAIRIKVNLAEYDTKYHKEAFWTDKKGDRHIEHLAYNANQANIEGKIYLYELPNLRLVATIDVNENLSVNDPISGRKAQARVALLKTAVSTAVSNSGFELKNLIAPKGYVSERRTDGSKSIFKVLIGRAQGIKQGDKVVIYSLRKETNALTGNEQMKEVSITEGTVSNQINDTASWVIPENTDTSMQVRLGDFVRVKYEEKSFLSKMVK
jgi:hypothetical protein